MELTLTVQKAPHGAEHMLGKFVPILGDWLSTRACGQ